jgi:O-antigen ligase
MPQGGAPQHDVLLAAGRALLYPGIALTSLLVLRGPAALPIGDIIIAAAGLCAVLSMRRPGHRLPSALRLSGGLLVVGGGLAATVSSSPVESLFVSARLVYMVVVVPWILLTLLVEQRHVIRAVGWWLGGAAVCGLGAAAQLVLGDVVPGGEITADSRFTGLTTNASDLAGITAMAAGATLVALAPAISRRARYAALVIFVACAGGLILSGSVSGMLGLLAALVFLFARRTIRLRRATAVAVLAALALTFFVTQLSAVGALNPVERFLRTTGVSATQAKDDTAGTRFELAERAIGAIRDSPVTGRGMVTDDNVLLQRFTVHNNLLGAWTAGGIFVFLGVGIATFTAIRYCWRRRPGDPLREAVAAAVIAALAFAQTAPGIFNRYYWMPIAFAIVLEVRSRSTRAEADAARHPAPARTT